MRTNKSLRVNRILLDRLSESLGVAMKFVDSSDVAMTVVMDAILFVRRSD